MLLSAIEILATILGIVYLYLEYKAKYALWIVGLFWSACYVFMFWHQGMMAWVITWAYYFFANIYGMIAWKRKDNETEQPPTNLKKSWIMPILLISVVLLIPLWLLEVQYNPYANNTWVIAGTVFSTAIGFTGMFLLAKKIVQQWFVWITVNLIYTAINIYTGYIGNQPTHYFTAAFFLGYTVMSVLGYLNWAKLAKQSC